MKMYMFMAVCSFIYHEDDQVDVSKCLPFNSGLREKSHTIHYQDKTWEDSIKSAWRWVINRQEAVPDWFGPLGCIKIYEFEPQLIGKDGYLRPATRGNFYEFKCDTSPPPEGMEKANIFGVRKLSSLEIHLRDKMAKGDTK